MTHILMLLRREQKSLQEQNNRRPNSGYIHRSSRRTNPTLSILLFPNDQLPPTPLAASSYAVDTQVLETIATDVNAEAVPDLSRISRRIAHIRTVRLSTIVVLLLRRLSAQVVTRRADQRSERLRKGALQVRRPHQPCDKLGLRLRTIERAVRQDWALI